MIPALTRLWTEDEVLRSWIREDLGIADFTSLLLGFEGEAVAVLKSREKCIVACTEEAARIYELTGAREVRVLKPTGSRVKPGETLLEVRGDPYSLHIAWRVAQNIVARCSGVATKAKRLVDIVRNISTKTVVAVTRKAPPGLRALYFKAALAGGAVPHRTSLSDTILVFENHIELIGGWEKLLETLKRVKETSPFRLVGVEVCSLKEALRVASAGADLVQLEKLNPVKAAQTIALLRARYPHLLIAVAGGIDEDNVASYAKAEPDIIVTSAPYHVKPIDLTTKIKRVPTRTSC